MDFFEKIMIAYLVAVSVLSPTLYFTYQWMFLGEEIAAAIGAVAFILGVWVFHNTLKRIEIENRDAWSS